MAAVPTAPVVPATTTTIFETIIRLIDGYTNTLKYDEALKVDSKYSPLDSFSNDPIEDVFVLFAFGRAHFKSPSQEERTCYFERAIPYFERAKERIDADAVSNDNERRQGQKLLKSKIRCLSCLCVFRRS